jgi:hypothetical protein
MLSIMLSQAWTNCAVKSTEAGYSPLMFQNSARLMQPKAPAVHRNLAAVHGSLR